MIITRTPYRVSFFGGGTDIEQWYREHGGEVLSTTINHYNYISCRYLPPFHIDHKNRIAWRILEYPNTLEEIQHNAVRAALKYYEIQNGVEISNQCDLPARSGLGSSSSFCVGLIRAIFALKGQMISKYALTREAIRLERVILGEYGGIQDQIATVYGGLNHVIINHNGTFSVEPIAISEERRQRFTNSLMLFFTGIVRTSSEIQERVVQKAKANVSKLSCMMEMVKKACAILSDEKANLDDFGHMLHDTWQLKRNLTARITTQFVDSIYEKACANGAIGGKLLGAGGGGFMLFYVPPERQDRILEALKNIIHVPFKLDDQGSQTILYSPKNYPVHIYSKRDYIHMLRGEDKE
jgi:D-glycero-alpha-D-manno-heptose-7-phosphate kinase